LEFAPTVLKSLTPNQIQLNQLKLFGITPARLKQEISMQSSGSPGAELKTCGPEDLN